MKSASLNDFLAMNDQLIALVEAGVPINVELAERDVDTSKALERIGAVVARRVGQGASLEEAVAQEPAVTPSYRCLVQMGLQSDDLSATLVGANRMAQSLQDAGHAVRLSLVYPAIVVGLAYVGMVGFCLFFVPTLTELYQSLRIADGLGLRVLRMLRATLPYWVAIPPLVLLLVVVWPRFKAKSTSAATSLRGLSWLPGTGKLIADQRATNFAETLATLLEAGLPLDEATRLATCAWGDAAKRRDWDRPAAHQQSADAPLQQQVTRLPLPPFLRWALLDADETIGRPRALRMAASLYRESAQRRLKRLGVVAPLVACVVLAGGVTLLYGLALFVPVVHMLRALS